MDAATNYPVRSLRRNSLTANAIVVVPSAAAMVIVLDLPLRAYPAVAGAGAIAAAYRSILSYSITEYFLRPPVEHIAAALADDFQLQASGLPLRKRPLISLFAFTAMSGLVVAALVTEGGGTGMLATGVIVSLAVGLALSHELTVLLSRAITDPIAHLRSALARVGQGDYDARVPVLSSDGLGELRNAFNRMAQRLAERERIREAFGI